MNYAEKLKSEGFAHVYEWTDAPGTKYPDHSHKGKVSYFVGAGSIIMKFGNNEVLVGTDERMDVPIGEMHTAVVGPEGCTYVVGEEIEGDS